MGTESIHWIVSVFRKGQDELIAEWSLRRLQTETAQQIFHTSVDELLEQPHILDPQEAAQLQRYAPKPMETQKYDYVLEGYEGESFWIHSALALLV